MTAVESTLAKYDREKRLLDLIIRGIPVLERETTQNLVDFVMKIAVYLEVNLIPQDIVRVYRYGARAKSRDQQQFNRISYPAILLQFGNERVKSDFVRKYRLKKDINLTILGFTTPTRIFINDNLSAVNFALLNEALNLKKQGKLFSAYSLGGRVFVRLLEKDTSGSLITSTGHLHNLIEGSGSSVSRRLHQDRRMEH